MNSLRAFKLAPSGQGVDWLGVWLGGVHIAGAYTVPFLHMKRTFSSPDMLGILQKCNALWEKKEN